MTFWENVLEDVIDRNASIVFVMFFKPWNQLELTCPNFSSSSYPLIVLLLVTYFEEHG